MSSSGDQAPVNTGAIAFAGSITMANYQWFELALAVHKNADGDDPSRAVFHVIPAVLYA